MAAAMSEPGKLLVLAVESSAARSAVAVLETVASCQLPVASGARSLADSSQTTANWQLTTVVRDFPRGSGGVGAGSPAAAAEAALAEAGRKASEVNLVAVSVGPGSYTGLRIGVSFAKTFAWAAGAEVVPVPSLLALARTAQAASLAPGILVATADAFRGQLYARAFRAGPSGELAELTGDLALAPGELAGRLAGLAGGGGPVRVFGSGAARYAGELAAAARGLGLALELAPGPLAPSAGEVGRAGLRLAAAGMTVTAHDLVPVYLRKTEAEERLERGERSPTP
jgi:tRNA threonylcarbamoyladenosine biosynthesis protein TsaB